VIAQRVLLGGAVVLCGVIAVAYAAGLSAPFLMDDRESIEENPTIESLWPIGRVLWYPAAGGRTIDGRPVLNLSFAVSRALCGPSARAYRLGNLAIHAANAVLLWMLAARVLRAARGCEAPRTDGWPSGPLVAAFVAAAIWAVHPLGVMAVTYVVQRAESLSALFMLVAVLAAVVGIEVDASGRPNRLVSVVALAAGCAGATKETAVAVPFITIAIDRAVLAGSWGGYSATGAGIWPRQWRSRSWP